MLEFLPILGGVALAVLWQLLRLRVSGFRLALATSAVGVMCSFAAGEVSTLWMSAPLDAAAVYVSCIAARAALAALFRMDRNGRTI